MSEGAIEAASWESEEPGIILGLEWDPKEGARSRRFEDGRDMVKYSTGTQFAPATTSVYRVLPLAAEKTENGTKQSRRK